jgi:hypothetical protein
MMVVLLYVVEHCNTRSSTEQTKGKKIVLYIIVFTLLTRVNNIILYIRTTSYCSEINAVCDDDCSVYIDDNNNNNNITNSRIIRFIRSTWPSEKACKDLYFNLPIIIQRFSVKRPDERTHATI